MPNVKLNVVLMGGTNDDELGDFIDFSERERVEVRFIEHMPMDGERVGRWHLDPREVVRALGREHEFEPLPSRRDGGPAERFRVGGAVIGFIHAMSNPFCDRCNRLRITASGEIFPCLMDEPRGNLLEAVKADDMSAVDAALDAAFAHKQATHPEVGHSVMTHIGG